MDQSHRILAVDDNPLNLEIVEEIFGHLVCLQCVTSGREAVRLARDFRPTVVLLDVMMPDMDGLATCRKLRELPELRECRIVMVSAKAMAWEREAGLEAGADDYVTKPFNEQDLLQLVSSTACPVGR